MTGQQRGEKWTLLNYKERENRQGKGKRVKRKERRRKREQKGRGNLHVHAIDALDQYFFVTLSHD